MDTANVIRPPRRSKRRGRRTIKTGTLTSLEWCRLAGLNCRGVSAACVALSHAAHGNGRPDVGAWLGRLAASLLQERLVEYEPRLSMTPLGERVHELEESGFTYEEAPTVAKDEIPEAA